MRNECYISLQSKKLQKPLLSGRLFPCGDFSFGTVPTAKKTPTEAEFDICYEAQQVVTSEYVGYRNENKHTTRFIPLHEMGPSLISTLVPNHHKSETRDYRKGQRYGTKGITGYGRKMVKSGAKVLEDLHGKTKLGFLTCTLPDWQGGLTHSDLFAIHSHWGEVTRQFLQNLARELERKGADTQIVCSTEIQEKRYKATGIPALHIHCVFNSWDGKSFDENGRHKWNLPVSLIRYYWQKALSNVLNRTPESINCNASINIQQIKKSAVGYLGKYLSKGAKITKEIIENKKEDWLPKQWWSLYGGLREAVIAGIINLDTDDCLAILDNRDAWQKGKILYRFTPVSAVINGREIIIGYSGLLTEWGYVLFLGDIAARDIAKCGGGDAPMG